MKKLYYLLTLLALTLAASNVMGQTTASFTERNVVNPGETMEFATGIYTAPPRDTFGVGLLVIQSGGTATLTGDVTFADNSWEGYYWTIGGAISIQHGGVFEGNGFTLTMTSNTSGSMGALVFNDDFFFDGSIVADGNIMTFGGGAAICSAGGSLTITGNVVMTNNLNIENSEQGGGAIFAVGDVNLGSADSIVTFTGNQDGLSGGAITHGWSDHSESSNTIITGSAINISDNSASQMGGAIFTSRLTSEEAGEANITFNLTAGGTMTAVGNSALLGGFIMTIADREDSSVNFNIGAGATATIGDANNIAGNIANSTDSIVGIGAHFTYLDEEPWYESGIDENVRVGLVKTGDGTLVLNQNNVYTGNTELNGGKTVINGILYGETDVTRLDEMLGTTVGTFSTANTGTTSVNNTATLAGSGTINGLVEVKSGGTLAPGREDGSVAALTLNALSMENGSVMEIFFGSQVIISDDTPGGLANAVVIDGSSTLDMLGAHLLTIGAEFTLISNLSGTAINGEFGTIMLDGMAVTNIGGDLYEFSGPLYSGTLQINYDGGTSGHDLTVTVIDIEVIPEPGTWALMFGGLSMLGYLQHARRNRR